MKSYYLAPLIAASCTCFDSLLPSMAETIFQSNDYIIPCNHIRQYARSTSSSQEDILHLAVKQYRPRYDIQDGDVTILACHASGMPKELYEPIWEAMFQRAEQRPAGSRIRAVWIADVANQGQSGVLNATKLGNDRESKALMSGMSS